MIYATVNMTIGDYSSTCDNKILLYRGDKNVEIRIVMKGNKFTVLDSTYAQMIIKRPSATSVFSKPAPIQNDTVVFVISEDMIDELKEIGEYTFQIRLYDDAMTARATLPPCNSALIIERPIAVEGEAAVNLAMVNDSAVMPADTTSVEEDTFTEDNKYNRTIWVEGDLITDARLNKIEDALYYINENGGNGGGGGATAPYISTELPETIMVGSDENFNLNLYFNSPNMGKGTLRVFINDADSMSIKIDQGDSTTVVPNNLFTKGTNRVVVYVLDRVGVMSNSLVFYIRYGSTEISSDFDPYSAYDYGATIRYYFTPTALDTSLSLTFYMSIDGQVQQGVNCTSDTRGYYTFPTNLSADSHYCEAYVVDSNGTKSNVLSFNLIILDEDTLVVVSDTKEVSAEEGEQVSLDYKVYMKYNTSFIANVYVDGALVNTGVCNADFNYYKTSSLTKGTHTIKLEVFDTTETHSDYITWTVSVTDSTYEMLQPVNAGAMFIGTAVNKTNTDERKQYFIGHDQEGNEVLGTLSNFAYNSESGWVNDELIISGNSHVEIPVKPLANNAKYGFTLDIEFTSKQIGVTDAEVLTLWNDETNCGIKITTEKLILQSSNGNKCDLYFTDNEKTHVMFVIDRQELKAKIYLNGVMCEAFHLNDYTVDGVAYLDDFTVNSNIILGGLNKNGYCKIRNLRVYQVALTTAEIMNNFISCEIDKAKQRELSEFQKGNDLPTLYVYCDFSGLGKDDKKPCKIVYNSTNEELYGKSFNLDHKQSQLQYQGTSSMAYPIKNYRLNLRDKNGDKWYYTLPTAQPECRFTLKADFMSSGHWTNTGMAKFINDNLYNYNVNDEKSMNPFKWNHIQNGGKVNDFRETITGFPCRLILVNDGETPLNTGQNEPTPGNTKDMGIFNFNNDKDNVTTLGFNSDIFPNCASYEVTANSDTSAGAFMSYSGDGDSAEELAYLKESFELRHPDADDVAEDWGFMGIPGEEGIGLKALIDWVDNCTDEEFVADFEQHFHKDYTLRYFCLVTLIGAVDNLGKNMMLDTADHKIFFPRFYDIDTICSYDNSGQLKFDVDIEMEQGYWNTSSSRLWTRIRDLMHDDIVATYNNMRQNGVSYENMMHYIYDEQISKIPQTYYNKDYDVKYAPFADSYIGMAHGDTYEHVKRWLKQRFTFVDTLFDYAPSYNNDILTIRVNTTEEITLHLETYTPVYQHLSWYNGQMDKKKIDGKTSITFSGKVQAATDQEVLIYGGSNIKKISGIQSGNPNRLILGSATKLTELDASNCPLLSEINMNKANLSPHEYLNKVNLSNCPLLEGNLRLNNSPLVQEINIKGTGITGMNLPSSIRNLQVLRLPNTMTELTLNDAGMLHTLEFDEGVKMKSIAMTNCNALENVINFDLLQTPSITLNNSYNTAAELYFRDTTNLSLSNMSNLERVIFTPNNEYETFEMIKVANAPDYKVTTFNCPKLSTFMTTAPYRESYNNGDYGDVQPNTTFTANSIDISNTQFTDVKLLCTTDTNTLKLPTTVKNFYCDSSFDLDTDYLEDGEYDVVHGELVEPYTTDYEGEVLLNGETPNLIPSSADGSLIFSMYAPSNTVAPASGTWDLHGLEFDNFHTFGMNNDVKPNEVIESIPNMDNLYCKQGQKQGNNDSNYNDVGWFDLSSFSECTVVTSDGSDIYRRWCVSVSGGAYTTNTVSSGGKIDDLCSLSFLKTVEWFELICDGVHYRYNISSIQKASLPSPRTVHIPSLKEVNRYLESITMPARYDDYNITIKNAYIAPKTHNTMLYPLLVNEDNPITGTLDYTNYAGKHLSWSFAYTDEEYVNITQPKDELLNSYEYRYNAFYETEYEFDNPYEIAIYTSSASGVLPSFNSEFGYTYDEIDNGDGTYTTKVYADSLDNLPTSISFSGKATLLTVDKLNTSNVTTMESMFYKCSSLTSLDLSGFDTSNVTNMGSMFRECKNLTSLDLSGWNTGNVTSIHTMFRDCSSLTSLDLSGFDTSNVTNMGETFYGCIDLTTLDVSGFDTSNVTNMNYIFQNCSSLTTLDVSGFDTSNISNMNSMFKNCNNLTSLDLSGFDTSNVTDMCEMFSGCNNLTSLDVSGFNTEIVTNMTNMFNGCSGLTSLDLSNFNTSNVTAISAMFNGCSKLTSLNVSNFNTSKVTSMSSMFYGCKTLITLDLRGFDTNKVTNMANMFRNCSNLIEIKGIKNWVTSKVTDVSYMFYACSIASLDLSYWDTSSLTNLKDFITSCGKLISLNLTNWPSDNVNTIISQLSASPSTSTLYGTVVIDESTLPSGWVYEFNNVNLFLQLTASVDSTSLVSFNTSFTAYEVSVISLGDNLYQHSYQYTNNDKPTSMTLTSLGKIKIISIEKLVLTNIYSTTNMFNGCSNITSIDLTGLDTSRVNNMTNMFNGCSKLTSLDVSGFNTSNVINMSNMFYKCGKLTSLDVSGFNTGNVTNMTNMFNGCGNLTSLDVSGFDTSKVTNMSYMFQNCSKLTSLDVSGFVTSKVSNMQSMFNGCSRLTSLDLSNFNTSNVTAISSMFNGCSKLTSLNVSNFNTSKVTSMSSMFQNCNNLTSLDVSGFDTGDVNTMSSMFDGCNSLTSLDVSGFNTSSVTNMNYVFYGCSSLTSLDLSGFDTSKVNTMSSMFYNCSKLTELDSMQNISVHLDLSYTILDVTSLLDVIDNLTTVTTTQELTLGSTLLAKLSESQIAIATNKGWAVA